MSPQLFKRYLGVTDSCSHICVLYTWLDIVLLDFTQAAFFAIYRRAVLLQVTWTAFV